MARNKVQFQKGLSEAEFSRLYGTEERCRAVLFQWRWPEGFVCPACGGLAHCVIRERGLYQCNACRAQTSLIAGTIFASTKLELTVWLRAMYLMTQTKQGISRLELSRRLGVSSRWSFGCCSLSRWRRRSVLASGSSCHWPLPASRYRACRNI